ncbi:hypothetical protein G6F22_021027 [Rhizopus arrhizus]|nr:hypothetical protein G6F22_021027 [Rhizopus arrhizus]
MRFVDKDVQDAGVMEVQQRGQQRQGRHGLFAAGLGQRQRRRQHRAAHAEPQGVDLGLLGDVAGHAQRLQDGVIQIIGPGGAVHAIGVASHRIAPGNQEHGVALTC